MHVGLVQIECHPLQTATARVDRLRVPSPPPLRSQSSTLSLLRRMGHHLSFFCIFPAKHSLRTNRRQLLRRPFFDATFSSAGKQICDFSLCPVHSTTSTATAPPPLNSIPFAPLLRILVQAGSSISRAHVPSSRSTIVMPAESRAGRARRGRSGRRICHALGDRHVTVSASLRTADYHIPRTPLLCSSQRPRQWAVISNSPDDHFRRCTSRFCLCRHRTDRFAFVYCIGCSRKDQSNLRRR